MKKLIFISSFLLLVYPLFAQGSTSQNLDNVLNARAKTAQHAASKKSQPSLQQVLQNLQNEELWWEYFLKENKRAKEIEMASTKMNAQAFKQVEESLDPSLADIIQAQTKNAPYETMAKGQSFIFISENISHDNATASGHAILMPCAPFTTSLSYTAGADT